MKANRFIKKIVSLLLINVLLLTGCTNSTVGKKNLSDKININNENLESNKKLKLIFTLDVEDKRESVPNLIECKFEDGEQCGVDYIMNAFEKYGIKGVFFVNIYEHKLYDNEYKNYMENLVKRISDRGNEVGLHAHSNSLLDFYKNDLNTYSLDEQKNIIQYGINFIERNTGTKPISFRAGAYGCNDNTFSALEQCGIKYDSSYYYGIKGNKFDKYNTLNQVCKVGNITEFPVIVGMNDEGKQKKLDFNSMTEKEIIDFINQMKTRKDFPLAQIMFHSFSFIDQKGGIGKEPYFVEGNHLGYGVDKKLIEKFENVLEYVKNDPDIEVVTFRDYSKLPEQIPQNESDGIFYTSTKKSKEAAEKFIFNSNKSSDVKTENLNAFKASDVVVKQDGNNLLLTNNYYYDGIKYAWYVVNDNNEAIEKSSYKDSNAFQYTLYNEGIYRIKAFVLDKENKKQSMYVATIRISSDGKASILN